MIYYFSVHKFRLNMAGNFAGLREPDDLYEVCLLNVVNYVQKSKCHRTQLKYVPDIVLMDVYFKMFQEKRLCVLGAELSDLDVFERLLRQFGTHTRLLQCFQAVIEHGTKLSQEITRLYLVKCDNEKLHRDYLIDLGLRLGSFLNEAGWYAQAESVLLRCRQLCQSATQTSHYKRLTLETCHRLLKTQSSYCLFPAAAETYALSLSLLGLPENVDSLDAIPPGPYAVVDTCSQSMQTDVAGVWDIQDLLSSCHVRSSGVQNMENLILRLFKEFSSLFFVRCDYNAAYRWGMEALKRLTTSTPTKISVEVLCACGKACVVKRQFPRAGVLLRQAVALCRHTAETQRAAAMLDYGFYLLNIDSINLSVSVYEEALCILRRVFGRSSLHVATAQEELAYALYVMEYSSGRFYKARDHAERAIRIIENLVPADHLLLASAKRVKALILEEIALDTPAGQDISEPSLLEESELLHKAALNLSMMAFGEKNVQTAKHYGNLGRLYQSMQKFQDAEAMHLKAIAIKEELLGAEDYEVGLSIGHLASLYNYHMNLHSAAEKLYLRSIAISLKVYGEGYSGLEYDYRGLVHVFLQLKRHDHAALYDNLLRRWYYLREESRAELQPGIDDVRLLPLRELKSRVFDTNTD